MQGVTQGVRVALVELNVVTGIDAGPDADRCADDERHGLGFGLSHRLGGRSLVITLVKQLMGELVDKHRHAVGWCERFEDRDAAWLGVAVRAVEIRQPYDDHRRVCDRLLKRREMDAWIAAGVMSQGG